MRVPQRSLSLPRLFVDVPRSCPTIEKTTIRPRAVTALTGEMTTTPVVMRCVPLSRPAAFTYSQRSLPQPRQPRPERYAAPYRSYDERPYDDRYDDRYMDRYDEPYYDRPPAPRYSADSDYRDDYHRGGGGGGGGRGGGRIGGDVVPNRRRNDRPPSAPNQSIVFLGLPPTTDEEILRGFLEDFGASVDSTTIIRDRQTGVSKRFGFARFSSVEHARAFLEPNFPTIVWKTKPGRGDPRDDGMRIRIDYSAQDKIPFDNSKASVYGYGGKRGRFWRLWRARSFV
jgi:hypothetical protein